MTEPTMIDRMAKAIYAARSSQPAAMAYPFVEGTWEDMHPSIQERYRNEARNALTAMREPTEAVIAAMRDSMPVDGHDWGFMEKEVVGGRTLDPAGDHWRALIDAALAEDQH